jgi:hypothetical protein
MAVEQSGLTTTTSRAPVAAQVATCASTVKLVWEIPPITSVLIPAPKSTVSRSWKPSPTTMIVLGVSRASVIGVRPALPHSKVEGGDKVLTDLISTFAHDQ